MGAAVATITVACAALVTAASGPAGAVPTNDIISTIAGNGFAGYIGDGGPASSATLDGPRSTQTDASGNLLIADAVNDAVRVIAVSASNPGYSLGGACAPSCTWAAGRIFTIAGTGVAGYNGDGIVATSAQLDNPTHAMPDSDGNVLITDFNNDLVRVVAVAASNHTYTLNACGGCTWAPGKIFTIAGLPNIAGYTGDGAGATAAELNGPEEAAVDALGNVIVTDFTNSVIRLVAVSASNPGYPLGGCSGSCTWAAGDIFTIAGTGLGSFDNDGQTATSAALNEPTSAVSDASGNVLIADTFNNRVRIVAVSALNPGYDLSGSFCASSCPQWTPGDIFSIAGDTPGPGYSGDGGPASVASLDHPWSVATDALGNIVIADLDANMAHVIAMSTFNPGYPLATCAPTCTWSFQEIFTIAGTGSVGSAGDGLPATSAELNSPHDAVPYDIGSPGAKVYIADFSNNRIRSIAIAPPLTVAASTAPVAPSISSGQDAVWTIQINNTSSVELDGVSATLHAFANGTTPLTFDGALMPGCAPGAGNSEVCSDLDNLAAYSSESLNVYVVTTGLTTTTHVTGDVAVPANGVAPVSGALAAVTIVSCGTSCTQAAATPGVVITLSPLPPTAAHPTNLSVTLPANQPTSPVQPGVAVTLQAINPGPTTSAGDRQLCPVTGPLPPCSGQISIVSGIFTKYANKFRPVKVKIIMKWPGAFPAGKVLMLKPSGGPPIQLPPCVASVFTGYNTPCLLSESTTGSPALHTVISTDTILFVGTDPHFSRRVVTTPNAPTAVTAVAGVKRATLRWKAPTVTNGAITGYVVTPYIGTVAQRATTFARVALTEVVMGLVTGKTYTFKVAAKNANGSSPLSVASAAVKAK